MKRQAFSLIELSIVILIIGILVAGITQSSRMVREFKRTSARNITKSSAVNGIKNLVSWYEPTLERSLRKTIDSSDSSNNYVDIWNDIAPTNVAKNNAVQSTSANQPIYVENSMNGLPTIRFDGTNDYLDLPDGTIPHSNSPYTIFVTLKIYSLTPVGGFLGSGLYGTANSANAFRYHSNGSLYNYWWDIDINSTAGSIVVNKPYILSFNYNLSARKIYINCSLDKTQTDSANSATISNNTIGVTNSSEYMNGDIAEIIIFDRSLKNEERKAVEAYLGKKWGIKVS